MIGGGGRLSQALRQTDEERGIAPVTWVSADHRVYPIQSIPAYEVGPDAVTAYWESLPPLGQ